MRFKIVKNTLWALSFSSISCMSMETEAVKNCRLHQIITTINKNSLLIVTALTQYAQQNGKELTPENLLSFLKPEQKDVDKLFLDNTSDDQLRPLTLSMGANIHARTDNDRTCLFFTNKPKVLSELIEKGAEVNTTGKQGDPLSYLLYYEPNAIEAAQVLLKHGANPNTPPVIPGAQPLIIQAAEKENIPLTRLLCEHKANVNIQNFLGETPLMLSIARGNIDIMTILLESNANPNLGDNYKKYPIHLAIPDEDENHVSNKKIVPQIALLLLKYNVNPNQPYPYIKKTPLHRAIEMNNPEVVEKLLEHKADTSAVNDKGLTPYTLAQQLKRSKIMSILTGIPSPEETQLKNSSLVSFVAIVDETEPQYYQEQRYCILQ